MRSVKSSALLLLAVALAARTAEAQGSCSTYPLVWPPPSNAEANAYADLATIVDPLLPEPTMYWSEARGTLTLLAPIDYVFPSCSGNVTNAFFTLAGTVPDLLPLNSSEWTAFANIQCHSVTSNPFTVHLKRNSLGGEDCFLDGLSFTVLNTGGGVMVRQILAEYVPVAPPAIAANMAACPDLTQSAAESTVYSSSFTYSIFDACAYVGQGTYTPGVGVEDTVTIVGDPFWEWEDVTTGSPSVLLRKLQLVHLVVDPLNVTQDLINSDAYCPPTVGFELVLDAVTGALVRQKPGIGCVVCLN